MNPEDIGRILDEIGQRIGPAGEYAWEITVRQVVIDSVLWGIVGLVLIVVAVAALIAVITGGDSHDWGGRRFTLIILGELGVLPGLIILATMGTHILNPEYHAMIRLLDRLVPGQ